jgi:hypothetical protein
VLNIKGVLLHNDLLSIVFEVGFISFAIFVYLLNAVKTAEQRIIALFITILFATDNVLIYQHLMFVYLLIQQSLSEIKSDNVPPKTTISTNRKTSKRILNYR